MMDHRSVREAVLDGLVDEPAVQEHLATCSACNAFHAALLTVDRLSPTILKDASPPDGLVARAIKYVSRHYSNDNVDRIPDVSLRPLPSRERFQTRLRRLRIAAGLTQEELAERSGISVDAISALEQGRRRRPRSSTVRFLAAALGLSEEEQTKLLLARWREDLEQPVLSARELEVARLIARRLSDKEIAARLGIRVRTAEYHVKQIHYKLGFISRWRIAAWVGWYDDAEV